MEETVKFAVIFSAGAAGVSAICALLVYLQSRILSTREKVDILKAEILRVVSTIEGQKQWSDALQKSFKENKGIAVNVESITPLLGSKYKRKKWRILVPAAIEELAHERYHKVTKGGNIPLSEKKIVDSKENNEDSS